MSNLQAILSMVGQPGQAKPQPATTSTSAPKPQQNGQKPIITSKPTPNNVVAGTKRRSEDPEPGPRPKAARTDANGVSSPFSSGAPSNRFQLGGNRPSSAQRPAAAQANTSKPLSAVTAKPTGASTPPVSSGLKGFAATLAKAKANQELSTASGPSTIKHQPIKPMSKRERRLAMEEAKAAAKSRSRSGTPKAAARPTGMAQKGKLPADAGAAKAAVKKEKIPLSYKGTMRTNTSSPSNPAKPAKLTSGKRRQDEYADWSDLSDASDGEVDEDEDGYGSDASSDMEGGFDDVEKEEQLSRRLAMKEDEEALAEEERLRREKRRRLEEMNRAAASKRRY